jgi:hypothetical protein
MNLLNITIRKDYRSLKMIKDFIKRLNNLGYYELNDIFDLAEIKETDKLKIQKLIRVNVPFTLNLKQ